MGFENRSAAKVCNADVVQKAVVVADETLVAAWVGIEGDLVIHGLADAKGFDRETLPICRDVLRRVVR